MAKQQDFNFEEAMKQIKNQYDFDLVALALVQSAKYSFVLKWAHILGNKSERYRRIVLQTGKGIAGTVLKTGKPMRMSSVELELHKADLYNYPIIVSESLTSFGAMPLFQEGRVNGVMLVAFRDKRVVTPELFKEVKQSIGQHFGPYHNEEMVAEI